MKSSGLSNARERRKKTNVTTYAFLGAAKCFFVSPVMFDVNEWNDDDPRIHKSANCRYRDQRTYLDIIYDLIAAGLLESVLP